MKLVLTLLTTFFLLAPAVSSSNTTIRQDPLEMGLFPGISAYPYIKLPYRSTVDGHHYYTGDSGYYKNDRFLLSKSLELYSESMSYTEIIKKYNVQYKELEDVIKKFDIVKKVTDAVVAAHTLDVKTTVYLILEGMAKEAKKGKNENDTVLFDIFFEAAKGAVDIAFEVSGKSTSLFGKYFPEYLMKSVGFVLAIYDGFIKSATLVNALSASTQTQEPIIRQAIKGIEFRFINDYVIKHKSNINAMKSDLLSRVESKFLRETYEKNITSFWGVWVLYFTLVNDNKILVSKVQNDYDTPPFDGKGGWFAEFAKAGMEVNNYINNYGHGIYFSVFTPKFKSIDSGKYTLIYEMSSMQQVNSLYFMPRDWRVLKFEFGGGGLSKTYSLLKVPKLKTTSPSLKKVIGLGGDGSKISEESRYVSFVSSYTVDINVFENNILMENEKMSASATNFVIPAYFGDMGEKDYSNKHIFKLFNDRVIIGNKDGSFNAKGNITIGELLKVVSLALLENGYKAEQIKNVNNISFSKYIEFLSKKGISTGVSGGDKNISYGNLASFATRGYMAKFLLNIIAKTNITDCEKSKKKGLTYKNDWDACSLPLKSRGYAAPNDYFRKDDFITRAEVFALISRIRENGGARY